MTTRPKHTTKQYRRRHSAVQTPKFDSAVIYIIYRNIFNLLHILYFNKVKQKRRRLDRQTESKCECKLENSHNDRDIETFIVHSFVLELTFFIASKNRYILVFIYAPHEIELNKFLPENRVRYRGRTLLTAIFKMFLRKRFPCKIRACRIHAASKRCKHRKNTAVCFPVPIPNGCVVCTKTLFTFGDVARYNVNSEMIYNSHYYTFIKCL